VEQWRRVSSTRGRHWWRVGSRAAAEKDRRQGRSETASSSSRLHRRWEATSPAKHPKRQQASLFQFCFQIGSFSFSLFRSAALSASFLFPLLLIQVAGGMTKGLLVNGFMSRLCSCWRPVRVLVRTRACGLLGGVLGGWERGWSDLETTAMRKRVGAVLWVCGRRCWGNQRGSRRCWWGRERCCWPVGWRTVRWPVGCRCWKKKKPKGKSWGTADFGLLLTEGQRKADHRERVKRMVDLGEGWNGNGEVLKWPGVRAAAGKSWETEIQKLGMRPRFLALCFLQREWAAALKQKWKLEFFIGRGALCFCWREGRSLEMVLGRKVPKMAEGEEGRWRY